VPSKVESWSAELFVVQLHVYTLVLSSNFPPPAEPLTPEHHFQTTTCVYVCGREIAPHRCSSWCGEGSGSFLGNGFFTVLSLIIVGGRLWLGNYLTAGAFYVITTLYQRVCVIIIPRIKFVNTLQDRSVLGRVGEGIGWHL
jgi:hypothetical protein